MEIYLLFSLANLEKNIQSVDETLTDHEEKVMREVMDRYCDTDAAYTV